MLVPEEAPDVKTGGRNKRNKSDDTRSCNNTILPLEDEHGIAQNMSRIIM